MVEDSELEVKLRRLMAEQIGFKHSFEQGLKDVLQEHRTKGIPLCHVCKITELGSDAHLVISETIAGHVYKLVAGVWCKRDDCPSHPPQD